LPFYNSSLTSHSLHSIKIYFQMERKPHANWSQAKLYKSWWPWVANFSSVLHL
jgi:hypothetical protein